MSNKKENKQEDNDAKIKNEEEDVNEERLASLQFAEYEKKIEELESIIIELKNEKLIARADAENANKRADKRISDSTRYANTNICKSLLEVSDNLRRAIISIPNDFVDHEVVKKLVTGVEMTSKELENVLEINGVNKIESLHEKFDPNIHQAIQKLETNEHEPGIVIEVIQDGYMIYDRLLRPSMVIVSQKPAQE
ncbi:MAG: nucleotide exchange factor GrpE [Pseudomonadota bacterium]|nr:nucleotide exchange factor GrpE [Pseudomonadota bacterium]